MKIEKIEKLKSGKYKIYFSDKETLITYDEVILKNNLLFHKDIDLKTFDLLYKDTSYFSIYYKTLKWIDKHLRSRYETVNYLKKLELEEIEINSIIEELSKRGFINDERFTEAYIADRIYLSKEGLNKIKSDLKKHNIEEDIIDKYLSKIDASDLKDQLYKIIDKKIRANHSYSRGILKQKIVNQCLDMGYDKEDIILIFDELYKEDTSILEREAFKIREKLSKKYEGKELEYRLVQKLYQKGFLQEEINKIKEED